MDDVGELEKGFVRVKVDSSIGRGGRESVDSAPIDDVVAKLCLVRPLSLLELFEAAYGAFAMLGSTIPSMSSRFMSRTNPASDRGDIMPSDSIEGRRYVGDGSEMGPDP